MSRQFDAKQAWELAFDVAVRTMTIEEAQDEAWMKVGGAVKLMIENSETVAKHYVRRDERPNEKTILKLIRDSDMYLQGVDEEVSIDLAKAIAERMVGNE